MELPKKRTDIVRRDPKTMVIFGQPKTGKTTILAALDNCLMLDLEEGSDFVSALKVDVIKEARSQKIAPIAVLHNVIKSIKKANEKNGGFVYKYIAIDTVTALEEMVLPIAAKMYKDTPKFIGATISNYSMNTLLIAGKSLYILYNYRIFTDKIIII